jgi:hypothetical protein
MCNRKLYCAKQSKAKQEIIKRMRPEATGAAGAAAAAPSGSSAPSCRPPDRQLPTAPDPAEMHRHASSTQHEERKRQVQEIAATIETDQEDDVVDCASLHGLGALVPRGDRVNCRAVEQLAQNAASKQAQSTK